jgi:hypothetical protein
MIRFRLSRNASITSVQASRGESPRLTSEPNSLRTTSLETPLPGVRGLAEPGLTLADAFHAGWQTSGSNAGHFRTLLGFNGFLTDDPARITGLSYRPQRTRNVLLAVSAIAWVVIIAGWVGGRRVHRVVSVMAILGWIAGRRFYRHLRVRLQ